jgi:transcriptional regulator of acetoin/glycerol metabolism
MTAKNTHKMLMIMLIMLIVIATSALFISNFMMQKSANNLVQAKLDNVGYDSEEQTYLQARKDLGEYTALNEIIQKILPQSKDQAEAVSELYKIGDETGIKIASITFPSSTLGQKSNSNTVTQAKSVDGMPGVLGIDIAIELEPASGASISYDSMINFLQRVELNRRNMQIKQITVNADTLHGGVTFNMTLTIFVKS